MMLDKLNPNQTKHILQVAIGIFAVFLLYTLRIFIDAFLGAVIIYVLFRPMMRHLSVKRKWKRGLSAVVVILSTLFIVIIPTVLIITYVVPKLINIVSDSAMITNVVNMADAKIRLLTGKQLFSSENIQTLSQKATVILTDLLGTTFNVLGDIVIMYFLLFYLLVNTGKVEDTFEDYVPFSHENILRFSRELQGMTYSNALGAPMIAVVQGIVAVIGFWIFGINEPLFWGIMCGLCSFIPAVGSAIIWAPAAIILIAEGNTWHGVGLLIFALAFIVVVENVLRISLQKRIANVHPIITILGFIIGIQLFGLSGIIFGPLLLSWFLLLLEIYRDEFFGSPVRKRHK